MKKDFSEYFQPDYQNINKLWNDGLFVLDTNLLLNLYRYSEETKREFLKVLNKLENRIWIPSYAAKEFFENRLNIIAHQEKSYDDTIASLKSIIGKFQNPRLHPHLSKDLLEKFSSLSLSICQELDYSKKQLQERMQDDDILENIRPIISKRVGESYSEETINDLIKEGKKRFELEIPPGYRDAFTKKGASQLAVQKYADFIVWTQIIEKAAKDQKCVILITDDKKDDWWLKHNGKTLTPRPELLSEFNEKTNQSFHMYQSDRFLEYANSYLKEKINKNAIDEIRDTRENIDFTNDNSRKDIISKAVEFEALQLLKEIQNIDNSLVKLKEKAGTNYFTVLSNDVEALKTSDLKDIKTNLESLMKRKARLKYELEVLKFAGRQGLDS